MAIKFGYQGRRPNYAERTREAAQKLFEKNTIVEVPVKAATGKSAISIRLDRDIIDFYKATGTGWQTRINSDLRALIAQKTG